VKSVIFVPLVTPNLEVQFINKISSTEGVWLKKKQRFVQAG